MAVSNMVASQGIAFHLNTPPSGFEVERDVPAGFREFFQKLHSRFAARQEELIAERKRVLEDSLEGNKPTHCYPREAVRNGWRIELPEWCQDQRNQMTGP